ncbi:MAG: rhodanese-like domain-containing protein [Candidatus Cryptobacteroides sp.]
MRRIIIMSILSAIFGLTGCNAQTKSFKSVNVDEFAKIITDSTVVRLDVRTPEEYAQGHIDKAINIDVLNPDFKDNATSSLPKDRTIALYCRSGNRSKTAAKVLSENGYKVIELESGYNGWLRAGK